MDKVFDAKIDNMGSIPGAHMVKGREPVPAGFLTFTHKINVMKRNFYIYINETVGWPSCSALFRLEH